MELVVCFQLSLTPPPSHLWVKQNDSRKEDKQPKKEEKPKKREGRDLFGILLSSPPPPLPISFQH